MKQSLRRFFYILGGKGRFKMGVLLVMMVINAVLEMVGVGAIPLFVMVLNNPETLFEHETAGAILAGLGMETTRDLLIGGSVFLMAVFLIKNLFFAFLIWVKNRIIHNQQVVLGNRLFRAYMKAPYTFFLNRNSAELLRNVNGETKLVISWVMIPLTKIIMQSMVLVMIVGLLLAVEPLVSVIAFAVLGGLSGLFIRFTSKKNKAYGKEEQDHRRRKNKTVLQGISGIKDVKVLGRENSFLEQYNFSAVRSAIALRYKKVVSELPKPFLETVAIAGILLIALMLWWQGRAVASIVPLLALFGTATVRLLPVFKEIVASYTMIRYSIFAVDPVYEDLKLLEKPAQKQFRIEKKHDRSPYPFEKAIRFRDVHYTYPNADTQAVRGITLDIPKNSSLAFVGSSGAGKTTMVDILLGLLEPQQGQVLADGQDIFEDPHRWQKNVGYIPQFIYLSDDTITNNICFGLPAGRIDETRLWEAIHAAQLEELISELPKGLDTIVGERGVRLSGGQRQRIGIARALYQNPKVLIMDEATSALDNVTERYVIEAIERLKGERTVIMIAHRLTTVKNCDILYMMKAGEIVDSGTYQDLITRSGEFQKMASVMEE